MKTHPIPRSKQLAVRQRQIAELVRCYRKELASWQAQLVRYSASLIIECTRTEWCLDHGGAP